MAAAHEPPSAASWMDVLRGEFGAEPFFTGYTGHAGKLAEAVQHADCIIAAGGDGTLHEVINAMDLDRQSLAVVPIGTGNGFGRALGLDSVSRAFQAIREGRTRRVNLVGYRLVCPAGSSRAAVFPPRGPVFCTMSSVSRTTA